MFDDEDLYDEDTPMVSLLCKQGNCDYCHSQECSHDCHKVWSNKAKG